jgi:hypothetical protein
MPFVEGAASRCPCTVTAFDPPRALDFDTIQDVQVGGVSGRSAGMEPRSRVFTGRRRATTVDGSIAPA